MKDGVVLVPVSKKLLGYAPMESLFEALCQRAAKYAEDAGVALGPVLAECEVDDQPMFIGTGETRTVVELVGE